MMRKWWVLLVVALSVFAVAFRPRPSIIYTPDFEADVWREHADLYDDVLSDQAHRLIRHRVLIGKTKAEVIDLLGKPSFALGQDGREDPDGSKLIYRLGPYGFVGVDFNWLTVRIGDDGRVSECYCWQD
jgi:hypothetical protein